MSITKETVIGDLVAKDYRTASVFKKHKIDFCCNGNRTIDEACNQREIDSSNLIQQLEEAMVSYSPTASDYASWPLDLLADYVEKKHHRYVETKIPEILSFLS